MDVEDAFRAYHRALYRFLARECGDSQLARDAVQETFLRLQRRPPEADSALRSWLFTTGLNVMRDAMRTAAARARLLERKAAKVPRPNRLEAPDERLERLEDGARLRRALAELRPRERVALLMREEGFKHREIADVLGTTTGSIGTLLSRALEKMAASMRQEGGGA
jgi:RNA polymerase sigma factor (sigma-70 family)